MTSPEPLPAHVMPMGIITIRYFLNGDGEGIVETTVPDNDDVPAIVQLGMLDLARESVLHPEEEDES